MPEIGEAEVSVVADGTTFGPSLRRQTGDMSRIGSTLGKTIGTALKRGVQLSMAAVGAIVTLALVKGFQRLKAIDDATGKLKGLRHSAKDVKAIMGDALKSVKGTAFGLGEAATLAATTVAAGVKPGKDLQRTLKLTADTATIAGTSLGEMGSIFAGVAASGKVSGEDLAQLTERGVPILKFLGAEFGVTQEKAAKMVSEGKVSFAEFQSAIEKNIGGAALKSGDTFTGALANIQAALGRAGAAFLGSVFTQMPAIFEQAIKWVDANTATFEHWGKIVGAVFEQAWLGVTAFIEVLKGEGTTTVGGFVGFMEQLAQSILNIINNDAVRKFFSDLWEVIQLVGQVVMQSLVPAFEDLMAIVSEQGLSGFKLFAELIGWMADHGEATKNIIVALGIAYLGWRVATALFNIAMGISNGLIAINTFLTDLNKKAVERNAGMLATWIRTSKIAQAISIIWTGIQWALNSSFLAFPVTWIVLAIIALIAVIVLLWKKNETFRKIVIAVWEGIKAVVKTVLDWFVNTLWPGIVGVWDAIVEGAQLLWDKIVEIWTAVTDFIKGVWESIASGAEWLWGKVTAVWDAITSAFFTVRDKFLEVAKAIFGFYETWIWPFFELFGAIVKWLWDHSVKPITKLIVDAFVWLGGWIKKVWDTVIKFVFDAIAWGFEQLGKAIKWVYDNIIKPTIDFFQRRWEVAKANFIRVKDLIAAAMRLLGEFIKRIYDTVIKPVIDFFQRRWETFRAAFDVVKTKVGSIMDAIGKKIKDVYNQTIQPIIDAFGGAMRWLQKVFEKVGEGIKNAWEYIKEAAKKPVEFVVNTVINKLLIKGFNSMAKTFGTSELPYIPWPPKGWYSGGPTGRGNRHSIAGPVHYDEHVVTAKEVDKTPGGHSTWEALRGLAASGQLWKLLPGRFMGGHDPVPGGVSSKHRGYPWARWAGDFHASTGTPVRAWKSGRVAALKNWNYSYGHHARINHPGNEQTLYAHLRDFAVNIGDAIGIGQVLGHSDNTGNSTGPHLHFEIKSGQGILGGTGNGSAATVIKSIIDHAAEFGSKFASPAKKLLDNAANIGKQPWAQWLKGMGKRIIQDMWVWTKTLPGAIEQLSGVGNAAGTAVSDPGGGGSNRSIGHRMMLKTWKENQWAALNSLWTRESGWNERAKNPSSGAYGIPQSLPASKMRSMGADYLTNPVTQIAWGLSYIKKVYGSPNSAWAHSQRTGWYDKGGLLPPGWSATFNGGSKPEPILTGAQWDDIHTLAMRGAEATNGMAGNVYVTMNVSVDDLDKMSKVGDFVKMLEMARVNSRKTLRSGRVAA